MTFGQTILPETSKAVGVEDQRSSSTRSRGQEVLRRSSIYEEGE